MQLTLGDQHWEAEGTSIKKAQHAAAAKALEGTRFPKPTARPSRNEGKNPGLCGCLQCLYSIGLQAACGHFIFYLFDYCVYIPPSSLKGT